MLSLGQNPADLVLQEIGESEFRFKEHHNFYVRAMFNALLPNFFDQTDYITEDDVSGELLEALRYIQQNVAPDLQEGEMVQVTYDDINRLYDLDNVFADYEINGIGDEIKMALGNFAMTKKDGKVRVLDAYDMEQSGKVDTLGMAIGTIREEGGIVYHSARYLGEKMFPAKKGGDGYSALEDSDYTQVRITLPDEPLHENIDFDDYAENEVNDYVLRGPMTNKRKQAFERVQQSLQAPPMNPLYNKVAEK